MIYKCVLYIVGVQLLNNVCKDPAVIVLIWVGS